MLKILLFSQKGAGNHYYGPGMSAYRLYNSLKSDEVSVSLAHGYKDQKHLDLFENQYFISDIKNKNVVSGLKFLKIAKKWIKHNANTFDVVHCLSAFHHSFMFAYWCEQMGVPAIIKISESKYTGFDKGSFQSSLLGLNRFRLKHSNTITGYISISSEIKQKLLEAGIMPDKIHDIPNGVDTKRFKPADETTKKQIRKRLNLKDKFTVIFTGAFCNRKNPYLLVRAFYDFSQEYDSQLILAGPDRDGGKQRNSIESFIQKHKINNIHLTGMVMNIEDYYQASDIFVLPSNQEGLSNSMLEAQACGLPCLVTKISGALDLINESLNGKFIDLNVESIFASLEKYYRDNQKLVNHSIGARNVISDSFNSEKILQKHLVIFQNLKKS
ncbi:MAG: glycosyltransferase family 4 protein [Balneolaceae bacterium]|nr:glycosyltransferase family 4 protein [Balneolaceae bacterium]